MKITNVEKALQSLIQTKQLTVDIARDLGLNPKAVENYSRLPKVTQVGMVERLIERFSLELGGSWVPAANSHES